MKRVFICHGYQSFVARVGAELKLPLPPASRAGGVGFGFHPLEAAIAIELEGKQSRMMMVMVVVTNKPLISNRKSGYCKVDEL